MKVLEKEIHKILDILKTKYKPQKVILFGSAVRGEFEEGSDLDFFIIKQTKLPRHRRPLEIYKFLNDQNLPIDFIIYTPEEFKERLSLGDFFIKRILKEGEVLYEK
ncbi:MAG: nucleotidyltransferase domain-containing protein [Candidatus Omnitrophica bacterium]|nr:nucleotidyltransferase domain-containing protein [Candidatus Omnitrophota bacterium]